MVRQVEITRRSAVLPHLFGCIMRAECQARRTGTQVASTRTNQEVAEYPIISTVMNTLLQFATDLTSSPASHNDNFLNSMISGSIADESDEYDTDEMLKEVFENHLLPTSFIQ